MVLDRTTRSLLLLRRMSFVLGLVVTLMVCVHHVEALSIRQSVLRVPSIFTAKTQLTATIDDETLAAPECTLVKSAVLAAWNDDSDYSKEMDTPPGFFALLNAIKTSGISLGLRGVPFVLRREELPVNFGQFFTMKDVAKAVEDDFLDAAKGSTDNRKGWKVRIV
jgi:hypothetical protein